MTPKCAMCGDYLPMGRLSAICAPCTINRDGTDKIRHVHLRINLGFIVLVALLSLNLWAMDIFGTWSWQHTLFLIMWVTCAGWALSWVHTRVTDCDECLHE